MIRTVVFDFGKVLASGEGVIEEAAALLGVPEQDYARVYWAGRTAYDAGCSGAEYWTPVLAALGKPTTPEMIDRLARLDARLWAVMRPTARELLRDVRAAGRTVAVLSNAPFSVDLAFADADYAPDADLWFVSASMGIVKPNPAIYTRVEEGTETAADEIAFIDDSALNVSAALRAGWTAHLWSSDADSRAWLTQIGVLPRR